MPEPAAAKSRRPRPAAETPPTRRPPPDSRADTRERLLDQGVTLLMEHGYHGAGLQAILQGVGVPKGSFYHYFPSKEDFSVEVIQHYIAPFIALLDAHLRRPGLTSAGNPCASRCGAIATSWRKVSHADRRKAISAAT